MTSGSGGRGREASSPTFHNVYDKREWGEGERGLISYLPQCVWQAGVGGGGERPHLLPSTMCTTSGSGGRGREASSPTFHNVYDKWEWREGERGLISYLPQCVRQAGVEGGGERPHLLPSTMCTTSGNGGRGREASSPTFHNVYDKWEWGEGERGLISYLPQCVRQVGVGGGGERPHLLPSTMCMTSGSGGGPHLLQCLLRVTCSSSPLILYALLEGVQEICCRLTQTYGVERLATRLGKSYSGELFDMFGMRVGCSSSFVHSCLYQHMWQTATHLTKQLFSGCFIITKQTWDAHAFSEIQTYNEVCSSSRWVGDFKQHLVQFHNVSQIPTSTN